MHDYSFFCVPGEGAEFGDGPRGKALHMPILASWRQAPEGTVRQKQPLIILSITEPGQTSETFRGIRHGSFFRFRVPLCPPRAGRAAGATGPFPTCFLWPQPIDPPQCHGEKRRHRGRRAMPWPQAWGRGHSFPRTWLRHTRTESSDDQHINKQHGHHLRVTYLSGGR